MFRIVCHPSSGSTELCLTEINRGGTHTAGSKVRCQTQTNTRKVRVYVSHHE